MQDVRKFFGILRKGTEVNESDMSVQVAKVASTGWTQQAKKYGKEIDEDEYKLIRDEVASVYLEHFFDLVDNFEYTTVDRDYLIERVAALVG